MSHTINIEDLTDFTKEVELAGSYGKGEHKTLVARIHIHARIVDFMVYDHKEIVVECDYLEDAVKVYNSL